MASGDAIRGSNLFLFFSCLFKSNLRVHAEVTFQIGSGTGCMLDVQWLRLMQGFVVLLGQFPSAAGSVQGVRRILQMKGFVLLVRPW